MPILDMPLAELKEYTGVNPRPADFEEYWEDALRELDGIDSRIELVPSKFQVSFAECFDMYFTGVRGAKIYVKLIRPKKRNAGMTNYSMPPPGLRLRRWTAGGREDCQKIPAG